MAKNAGANTNVSGGGKNSDAFNDLGQVVYGIWDGEDDSDILLWTPPSIDDVLPGDANFDGVVSILDFALLRANFGTADPAYFATGDFNGDGGVSILDFAILRANFGGTAQEFAALDAWAATVPEPSVAVAGLAGGLLLLRRRNEKRRH